jgi:hypothetical protein
MRVFVKELKSVIAERSQVKMLQLSDKIYEVEEKGYEFSDEEELLIEQLMKILDEI